MHCNVMYCNNYCIVLFGLVWGLPVSFCFFSIWIMVFIALYCILKCYVLYWIMYLFSLVLIGKFLIGCVSRLIWIRLLSFFYWLGVCLIWFLSVSFDLMVWSDMFIYFFLYLQVVLLSTGTQWRTETDYWL